MKKSATLLTAIILGSAGAMMAQTPSTTPSQPTNSKVVKKQVSADHITLVKDANLPPIGEHTVGNSLESQYVTKGPVDITSPDNKPLDINKVQIITPQAYEALSAEEKKKIDEDPYYMVTNKSRKEAMVEMIRSYSNQSVEPQKAEPASPK